MSKYRTAHSDLDWYQDCNPEPRIEGDEEIDWPAAMDRYAAQCREPDPPAEPLSSRAAIGTFLAMAIAGWLIGIGLTIAVIAAIRSLP